METAALLLASLAFVAGSPADFRDREVSTIDASLRKVFLYGSRKLESGERENIVEVWTPETPEPTVIRPLPHQGRFGRSRALLPSGVILTCGGTEIIWRLSQGIHYFNGQTLFASCEVLDPVTLKTTTTTPLPEPRYYHAAVALGDSVILCGGSSEENPIRGNEATRSDCLRYKDGEWKEMAPMTEPRSSFHLVSNGSSVFACGGQVGDDLGDIPTTCEFYDPAQETWTSIMLPATLGRLSAAFGGDGRLYIVGENRAPARVDIFDPASEIWSQGPALSENYTAIETGLNVDGNIWVFVHVHGDKERSLFILESGAQKWSKVQDYRISEFPFPIESIIYLRPSRLAENPDTFSLI